MKKEYKTVCAICDLKAEIESRKPRIVVVEKDEDDPRSVTELAKKLYARRTGIPIKFVSAYTQNSPLLEYAGLSPTIYERKPLKFPKHKSLSKRLGK